MKQQLLNIWEKIKQGFRQFMQGRYGQDSMSKAMLIASIALYLIFMFSGLLILYLIAVALIVWTCFRALSRNETKRRAENERYEALLSKVKNAFFDAKDNFDEWRIRHSR